MLGLANLLESLGKSVFLYNRSGIPSFLKFLPGSEKIERSLPKAGKPVFDALVVLDCPAASRAGSDFENYVSSSGTPLVIIDHHKEAPGGEMLKWVETESPATGVLVYEIFREFASPFSRDSATCIFAAIAGDTGSFRFNATAQSFAIASEMVSSGADPQKISSEIYENNSVRKLKLLSRVLETLKTDKTGKIAWVRIDADMFESTGTSAEDSEGMVDIPMSLAGVEVAMLFRRQSTEAKSFWKASIRSRGDIDVCAVANTFGGGGHKNASGFTFESDFDGTIEKIVDRIKRA